MWIHHTSKNRLIASPSDVQPVACHICFPYQLEEEVKVSRFCSSITVLIQSVPCNLIKLCPQSFANKKIFELVAKQ